MTVLATAKKVALRIGMEQPDALLSSTTREHLELAEILQECAEQIAFDSGHDWEALLTLKTISGDGATSSFALPTDFKRMPVAAQIWTTRLDAPLRVIDEVDAWLEIDIRDADYVSGVWTRIGGSVQVKPTPTASETLKYYYITNKIVSPSGGSDQATFTADTDSFVLDERLLKLCAIWQWKEAKGIEYAEDMQTYQDALAQAIVADKPSRRLSVGKRRVWTGARRAYPEALS